MAKQEKKAEAQKPVEPELELFMVQNVVSGQYFETGKARSPATTSPQPTPIKVSAITLKGSDVIVDLVVDAKRRTEINTGSFNVYYGDRLVFHKSNAELHYRRPLPVVEEVVHEASSLEIREGARIEVGPVIEKGTPLGEATFEDADDLNSEPIKHPSRIP